MHPRQIRQPLTSSIASTLLGIAALGLTSASTKGQKITNPIPTPISKGEITVELEPIGKGLASPVQLVAAPDESGRLLVVDQSGLVRVIQAGKLTAEPFLDLRDRLVSLNSDFDERGLLGLAFDPEFADPKSSGYRRLFTYSSEKPIATSDAPNPHAQGAQPNHQSVLASWRATEDGLKAQPNSRKELLRIDQPQFNHNGGMVAFGPDGLLYIGLGDGGAANDLGPGHNPETGNSQDPHVLLGKMLRIDVNGTDSKNGAYGIPKDNPFAHGGGAPEIFALGLRNPYRFSFNNGALLVGDVGQNQLEMLYRVERGGNYGWRLKEGTFKFNKDGSIEKPGSDLPHGLTDPVLQYDRDEGTSIIGGHVYRGTSIPQLSGKYLFGDYRHPKSNSTGRLFVSSLAVGDLRELRIGKAGRELGFLLKGFGEDAEGELYVLGSAEPGPVGSSGVVMKLIPARD
jgi:glucose/arabinose dehydrogenase